VNRSVASLIGCRTLPDEAQLATSNMQVIPDLGRGSLSFARLTYYVRITCAALADTLRVRLSAAAVEGDEEVVGVGEEFFVDVGTGEFH
jgi:hypothetical protein